MQGEAEEQDRPGRQEIVERDRQREQHDQQQPGDLEQSSPQTRHPPATTGMNGILQPFDVPSDARQEILQLAARQAAAADDVGQRGHGTPEEVLHHEQEHRHAGDGREPGNAGRDAIGQVERGNGEGVGAALQPFQERLDRQDGIARAREQPVERRQQRAAFAHPPARASRRRASTRCGRSSILPSSVSTPDVGLLSKVATTRVGPVDFLRRRREDLVDDRDLVGMNGDLAAIAHASRVIRLGAQALEILDVGIDRVVGGDAGRHRRHQVDGARELEGVVVNARRRSLGERTEIGHQILAAPGMAHQARMLGRRGGERQHGRGAFGGDGQDPGRAGRDAFARFECIEIVCQQVEIGLADAFGEDNAVGPALHDDGEIAQGQAGVEGVDAHIELGAGAVGALEIGERHVARDLLAIGGDGILEVEDQPVGAGRGALGELALRIGGDEQEGSHRFALSFWICCVCRS